MNVNYLLDGLYVICEFSDSGDVLREYVPGVSVSIGGISYFYHYDRLGSVRFMSDEGGNIVQEYVYDVWGNLVSSSGSVSQPYEYVGREGYYREGELYLLGQRWYDSEVGRFISRDPIGEEGGVNLYVYVGNDSMNKVDPIGTNPYLIGRLLACVTCAYLIYDQAKEYWDFYKDLFQECVNKGSTKEKIECYANLLGKILNDQFNPLCKKINIIKDITCTICIGPKLPPPPPLPIEKCTLPCPAQ